MKALGGVALCLIGVLIFLFPQWNAEASAKTQRFWIRVLPWLKRRDPDDDWLTDVGTWRVATRFLAVILVIVGVRVILRS